ncbi:hypothetical protein [Chitinophaga lutea]|nr:hypothetical protein [Chitinophaga lutea]
MKKLSALLPWNLCLLLTTIKVVTEGMTNPTFHLPLLGPAYTVSGQPAVFLYGMLLCVMLFCAWASYRILFNQKHHLLVDTIPNYLIFLGTRYFIPLIILEFISTDENSILRQPVITNPIFWMTFGYFMMTDTVIFWRRFQPDDRISFRVFGRQFEVKVRYLFWLSVLVETVFFTTEMNKYSHPAKSKDANREELPRDREG